VERAPGLSDYLQGNAAPQEILQVVDLAAPVPGEKPSSLPRSQPSAGTLVCIAAGSPVTNPAELLASERFEDLLTKVRKLYDLVIVDSGPVLAVVDPLTIMPMVDCALVCVRVQATTKEQARATKSALGNLPPRPMGAVITGIKHGGPDSYDYYYGY
jgi:Mrp family chromosome partitioning ATPase